MSSEYVVRMRDYKNTSKILSGKPTGKPLERPRWECIRINV